MILKIEGWGQTSFGTTGKIFLDQKRLVWAQTGGLAAEEGAGVRHSNITPKVFGDRVYPRAGKLQRARTLFWRQAGPTQAAYPFPMPGMSVLNDL